MDLPLPRQSHDAEDRFSISTRSIADICSFGIGDYGYIPGIESLAYFKF
jgi:hypothetical protein